MRVDFTSRSKHPKGSAERYSLRQNTTCELQNNITNSSTKGRQVFHTSHFLPFKFCSLKKGLTPKIRMLCFEMVISVLFNLWCVWFLIYNAYSHSCFRYFGFFFFFFLNTKTTQLNQKQISGLALRLIFLVSHRLIVKCRFAA